MEVFSTAFVATLAALVDIMLVIVAAGLLVRRGIVTQSHVDGLSSASVVVFLPCLMFAKVIRTLDPGALPLWWAIPLMGAGMSLAALVIAWIAFRSELPAKRNMLPLASMQNAGYLVLPVGLKLFPGSFDAFALYCFLFILGCNPVLWSVGKLLTTSTAREAPHWRGLLTPPLVANLLAIALVLTGVAAAIPHQLIDAVDLMGSAAVPVATFVLGAVLGSIRISLRPHVADAVKTAGIKLVVVPALAAAILHWIDLQSSEPLLARFLIIEAAAAPAVAIILQVRTYGGDEQKIGSLMLVSYLACALTLPFWVASWDVLVSR